MLSFRRQSPAPHRRHRVGCLLVALTAGLVLTTACGSDSEPGGPATDDTASSRPGADSACDNADQIIEYAGRVDSQLLMTSTSLGTDLKEAHDFFTSAEAPEGLSDSWTQVGDFLGALVDAYGDVEKPTSDDIAAGAASLGEEAMGRAEQALTASKAIADHLHHECGGDQAEASASDPCALLGEADLAKVFGDNPIPEAEDGSVGAGYYGCEWELDADDMKADDFNVTIAIVPVDSLESDYLSKMKPLGDVDGVADGHSFDGTVGVMGGSSRGHSVSFSVGDVGGFVGVQKGNDGDPDTEIGLATEFTKKVVTQLG